MTTLQANNISINGNRIAIELPNAKTAQFVIWDLEENQHEDVMNNFMFAFQFNTEFDGIVTHMKSNGFDCELEDIY